MADVDYGTDLSWTDDCDAADRTTSGIVLLGQAVYRRLTCPRGRLIDDPDYGIDLRELLHLATTATERAALPGRIQQEVLKDERIDTADVAVTATALGIWKVAIKCESGLGPFRLVVSVSAVTVELLESP